MDTGIWATATASQSYWAAASGQKARATGLSSASLESTTSSWWNLAEPGFSEDSHRVLLFNPCSLPVSDTSSSNTFPNTLHSHPTVREKQAVHTKQTLPCISLDAHTNFLLPDMPLRLGETCEGDSQGLQALVPVQTALKVCAWAEQAITFVKLWVYCLAAIVKLQVGPTRWLNG